MVVEHETDRDIKFVNIECAEMQQFSRTRLQSAIAKNGVVQSSDIMILFVQVC
jgi:hypothetical protein